MKSNRYRRISTRLGMVIAFGNMAGALIIAVYLNIIHQYHTWENNQDLYTTAVISITVTATLLVIGSILAWRRTKPLDDWYKRAAAGLETGPAPLNIRRDALNRPVISASVSWGMWMLAGVTHSIIAAMSTASSTFDWSTFTATFVGISAIAGPVTTAIIYFATERIWRHELELFFPDGNLNATPSFKVTVRRRLLILFIVGILPLFALATLSYEWGTQIAYTQQPEAMLSGLLRLEIFIVGIGTLLTVALALTVGASLVEPLETLNREMTAVRSGDLEGYIPVTSNDEMGLLSEGFNAMVDGLRREETIHNLFQRYVTPQVAEYAIQHGANLGGQLVTASVVFSDIRGFTSLTERMEPAALIALLNRYFQTVTAAVIEHGGLVNKFGGDSLLAIFGTPLNPADDHPRLAVLTAQEMLTALSRFNRDQEQRGEPTLRIGIGVATGPVLAGNVGSTERLEYTVIGDTVNLASRLENMTKELRVPILISETTAQGVSEEIKLEPIGNIHVRGKQKPVYVYAIKE